MTRHLFLTVLMTAFAHGVELNTLPHKAIHDDRTYIRDDTDRRYSVWTTDQSKALNLLKDYGIVLPNFQLHKGEVLAIFLNDNITQDLIQIVHNKTANTTFADYADSGIEFRLKASDKGKKYSHVTAVVFSPIGTPSHLGLRDMVPNKLSEKK